MNLRPMSLLLICLHSLGIAGCPDLTEAPIPKVCAALGDKCKLPDGPLGVCMETACSGPSRPCFVCQPQH